MRKAIVYMKGIAAGTLTEDDNGYTFVYDDTYFADSAMPDISLTLSKKQKEHVSAYLFPFFFSMLSEGGNKAAQCRLLKIDENDYFGLLLATADHDTIGAITVKPIEL